MVNDAIEAYGDVNVGLQEGPPHYLYGEEDECRKVLERSGFDGNSMNYETRTVEWHLPTASYFFHAERDAGVRTAGLLARQSRERLDAIRIAVEKGSGDMPAETSSSYRWRHTLSSHRKRKKPFTRF